MLKTKKTESKQKKNFWVSARDKNQNPRQGEGPCPSHCVYFLTTPAAKLTICTHCSASEMYVWTSGVYSGPGLVLLLLGKSLPSPFRFRKGLLSRAEHPIYTASIH